MLRAREIPFISKYVNFRKESILGQKKLLVSYPPLHSLLLLDSSMKVLFTLCDGKNSVNEIKRKIPSWDKNFDNTFLFLIKKGVIQLK